MPILLPVFFHGPDTVVRYIHSVDAAESLAKDFKVITRLFLKQWNFENQV